MFSKEFLTNDIPVLSLNDTGSFALSQMGEYKLKHLPVVERENYAFLVSEKDIFAMDNPDDKLHEATFFTPCAGEQTSILDIIRIVNEYKLTLLPVIDSEGKYKGAILLDDLIEKIGDLCNVRIEGSIIALELNSLDYILSQIIHLVEQNNARVLNVFSYMEEQTSKQILILKIDLEDASNVIRSLERFNYPVKYYAQKQMISNEVLRNRFDELMHYLETL
ncbi:MAG: CBS domain-containing protein [Dysgonamonadaceae bacterium]|jgi:CBS domain-containing protein|nr:CBS domain-containing protein [Dysgonamonadaceae bacterium]